MPPLTTEERTTEWAPRPNNSTPRMTKLPKPSIERRGVTRPLPRRVLTHRDALHKHATARPTNSAARSPSIVARVALTTTPVPERLMRSQGRTSSCRRPPAKGPSPPASSDYRRICGSADPRFNRARGNLGARGGIRTRTTPKDPRGLRSTPTLGLVPSSAFLALRSRSQVRPPRAHTPRAVDVGRSRARFVRGNARVVHPPVEPVWALGLPIRCPGSYVVRNAKTERTSDNKCGRRCSATAHECRDLRVCPV